MRSACSAQPVPRAPDIIIIIIVVIIIVVIIIIAIIIVDVFKVA